MPIAGIAVGILLMGERVLNSRHCDLLGERGIDPEIFTRLGGESCNKLGADTIMIPYYRDGQVVGRKYRTIGGDKQFSQEPGSAQILYNIDCLNDQSLADQPVIVTEGEIDCWSAIQAGYPRTVSVPGGAPATAVGDRASVKYDFLAALTALPEKQTIIIAVDSDDAGAALLSDLTLRLGAARCKWLRYPKECKDLNDALRRYGVRGVVESINRAEWCDISDLCDIDEIPPVSEALAYDSGFPGLAGHYKLRLGDFCVVTGIPSHGKTTVVMDIACRMARYHNWPVCFASFEQHPLLDMQRKMRTWYGQRPLKEMSQEQVREAHAWIKKMFRFVYPGKDSYPTFPWVMDRFAASAIRYGTRLFVLDPWNELEHNKPSTMSLTEYVGECLRDIRHFAAKYEAHVIVVAHPAKMRRDKGGEYPVPDLYDISDSAHWSNKADVGIVVHRDFKTDETAIRVAKVRFQDVIGKPGEIKVRYNWKTASYEPINQPPYTSDPRVPD